MFDFKLKWTKAFDSEEELQRRFAGKSQAVTRSNFGSVLWVQNDGKIHAFRNRCPHQGKPLDDCWLSEGNVVCPFHRYHFSIDNGRGHGTSLFKYEVKIEDGAVWLGKEVFSLF